jgi:hypothetical protein
MTCEQCLSELATGSLREMTADSAVMQHCVTCPDCARLTTLLRDREYNAANILNDLPPMSNPITVAETSVSTAQRRRTGRVVVMLSGAALALTIWFAAAKIFYPAMNRTEALGSSALRTETIPLQCLSPEQAADIINPYVRSHGSTYFTPTSGISAITVRGTSSEVAKSRELLANFESDPAAACRHSVGAEVQDVTDQIFAAQKAAMDAARAKIPTASERPEQPERPQQPERPEQRERTAPKKP